jgi:hypothetical protein
MLSGYLCYESRIDGVEFENIEIPSKWPIVQKVEVTSDKDGKISIKVHVECVSDQAEAEAEGLREATRIVNILAIQQGKYVTDPMYMSHVLYDKSADTHLIGDSVRLFDKADGVNRLGDQSRAALRSALAEATPPGEADYQLFRNTLNTKDVASKFLSLYRLLGHLADPGQDRQGKIDAMIKKHEPGVAEEPSPKTGGMETVYTKLRNEHMHRSGIPLAQVRDEMGRHLPGLQAIVQKAIKNS